MQTSTLKADKLSKSYRGRHAVKEVSLEVSRGQVVGLLGPNGAGKTTTFYMITGVLRPDEGSIQLNEVDITRYPMHLRARSGLGYLAQERSIFRKLTVEENLLMGGFLKNKPAEAKIAAEEVFDKYTRLADRRDKPAGVLSGGERRLLEISRALVMRPKVLLVDEPSIGLEPRFIDMVFEILDDLQRRDGKTIIMVEQNAKKGLAFADIGYVLVSGETAIAGDGDGLLENPDVGRLFLGG